MLANWQNELHHAGKYPQDYVGFILNIICQVSGLGVCLCSVQAQRAAEHEKVFVGQIPRREPVTVYPSSYIFLLLPPPL